MFIINMADLLGLAIITILLLIFGIVYLIINIKDWFINKKRKCKTEENREIAINIIEEFEKLLEKNYIKIPNESREDAKDESCIYGDDYYELEDTITEILNNRKK